MRDVLARFRFGDFAAYLLPGIAFLAGIAVALRFTPLRRIAAIHFDDISFVEAFLVGCAAYLCGALVSGSSFRLVKPFFAATRLQRYRDPRLSIQPASIAAAVEEAFRRLFGETAPGEWGETKFYLIRSAVHERLPHASAEAMRQNDLGRLRENMLLPLIIWCFAAILLAIDQSAERLWFAFAIAIAAVLLTYVLGGRLACRATDNRAREVREVCVAFLVGDRLNVWAVRPGDEPPRAAAKEIPIETRPPDVLPVVGPVSGTA